MAGSFGTAFEKVLRRVLRRCLAVDFHGKKAGGLRRVLRRGSKKGLSRRHLEGRSTPFQEYDPVGVCHNLGIPRVRHSQNRPRLKKSERSLWGESPRKSPGVPADAPKRVKNESPGDSASQNSPVC